MDDKTRLLDEMTKKAAAVAEAIKSCNDPEFLVQATKLVRKQIPFRYRRYAAAWLLLAEAAENKKSGGKNAKTSAPAKNPVPVTAGFINLFVNVGKRNKLTAVELSRHFGKTLDIPLTKIANVKILPVYSFIEVEAEEADRAVKEVSGTTLCNRKITVSYSTKK